jgi:peptidoglycan/xylan/chitin deacetylase (PgdA/CDA1 family)
VILGGAVKISRTAARLAHLVNDRTFAFDLDKVRGVISRFPNAKNQICLTFDDGPSGYATSEILDCLGQYAVCATFFCTGLNAQRHPELLQEIIRHGHEVASHSMTHPDFQRSPIAIVYREMKDSRRLLEKIGGRRVSSFRAPYGNFSWEVRPIGKLIGTPHLIGWDVAPNGRDPVAMAEFIVKETASGSIILLHDGFADQAPELSAEISRVAAESVKLAIPILLDKGFNFTTISEQLYCGH